MPDSKFWKAIERFDQALNRDQGRSRPEKVLKSDGYNFYYVTDVSSDSPAPTKDPASKEK